MKYLVYIDSSTPTEPVEIEADDFTYSDELSFSIGTGEDYRIVAVFSKYEWKYFIEKKEGE